jgi:hypothetical protein
MLGGRAPHRTSAGPPFGHTLAGRIAGRESTAPCANRRGLRAARAAPPCDVATRSSRRIRRSTRRGIVGGQTSGLCCLGHSALRRPLARGGALFRLPDSLLTTGVRTLLPTHVLVRVARLGEVIGQPRVKQVSHEALLAADVASLAAASSGCSLSSLNKVGLATSPRSWRARPSEIRLIGGLTDSGSKIRVGSVMMGLRSVMVHRERCAGNTLGGGWPCQRSFHFYARQTPATSVKFRSTWWIFQPDLRAKLKLIC